MEVVHVASCAFGDRASEWQRWMLKSLKLPHPNAKHYPIEMTWYEIQKRFGVMAPRAARGFWKVKAWTDIPTRPLSGGLWVLDADVLVLKPLIWKPANPETIMAAAIGGDEKYLNFMEKAGVELQNDAHFNAGVLWINGDLAPIWDKWYQPICDVVGPTSYPLAECVLNAVWHELRREDKAEVLPVAYNQIISEHGPYGATVFHLAGSPEHFRARLMESYYRALLNPEV